MKNASVSVTTTATRLVDGNPNRTLLSVTNVGVDTVYMGASDVSSTAFVIPLDPDENVQLFFDGVDRSAVARWFGVSASGTVLVSVGEVVA